MEDILASIRRILSEEEAPPATPPDVLVLDQSMEVPSGTEREHDRAPAEASRAEVAAERPEESMRPLAEPLPPPEPAREEVPMSFEAEPARDAPPDGAPIGEGLVAEETRTAAATAMGGLVRRLALERQAAVYRGGPTIEDVVREEMRPLLKSWLDANLPGMVERLVREEIERVVKRAAL